MTCRLPRTARTKQPAPPPRPALLPYDSHRGTERPRAGREARMSGDALTHLTAVAAVPPEAVWGPIQDIRRQYDRQFRRWMPHVNLLYPFRPRPDFPPGAEGLTATCRGVGPFEVTLAEFRFFRHGSGRCTLWLAPEPAEEV